MSDHCNKCGFDIVYPEGTWPLGICLNCTQSDEIDFLKDALERLTTMEAFTGIAVDLRFADTDILKRELHARQVYARQALDAVAPSEARA